MSNVSDQSVLSNSQGSPIVTPVSTPPIAPPPLIRPGISPFPDACPLLSPCEYSQLMHAGSSPTLLPLEESSEPDSPRFVSALTLFKSVIDSD